MILRGHWFRQSYFPLRLTGCSPPRGDREGQLSSIQVAVIHDQDIWSQACGANTSTDHVYMNASVQKVFTATAVQQHVENGLFNLDGHISEYVLFVVRKPSFPKTPITVQMVLAHRSGLDAFLYQFDWDTESIPWWSYCSE